VNDRDAFDRRMQAHAVVVGGRWEVGGGEGGGDSHAVVVGGGLE
jgi:hypothetical protein